MAPRETRILLRAVHVAFGACVAVVVYAPAAWAEPFRLVLGILVLPAVVLTGLAMWQQGRIRRLLARTRRRADADRTGGGG